MNKIKELKGFVDFPFPLKLLADKPLDARLSGKDETFLQSIIDAGAAYPGLTVFIESSQEYYSYVGSPETGYSFKVLDGVLRITDNNFPEFLSEETYRKIYNRLSSGETQIIIKGIKQNYNTYESIYGFVYAYDTSDAPLYGENGEDIIGHSSGYSIYLTIKGVGYWSSFEYNEYDEGKGTSSIYVTTPLEKLPTELEKTIPDIRVITLSNFPDNFGFHDSVYLGDMMSGLKDDGTPASPPDTIIIQNNKGQHGVMLSYDKSGGDPHIAKVLFGEYIYTYYCGGFESPEVGGYFKKETIVGKEYVDNSRKYYKHIFGVNICDADQFDLTFTIEDINTTSTAIMSTDDISFEQYSQKFLPWLRNRYGLGAYLLTTGYYEDRHAAKFHPIVSLQLLGAKIDDTDLVISYPGGNGSYSTLRLLNLPNQNRALVGIIETIIEL